MGVPAFLLAAVIAFFFTIPVYSLPSRVGQNSGGPVEDQVPGIQIGIRGSTTGENFLDAAPSEAVDMEELAAVLREAENFFERGIRASDPETSQYLYRQSLLRYERIARQGIRNGRLFYNIGNTYYRLGELGKAILYYRRAQLYIPFDSNLQQNLRYVRSQRVDRINSRYSGVLPRTFFWYRLLSPRQRAVLFVLSTAAAWGVGILLIMKRRKWKLITVGLLAGLSLLLMVSLAADLITAKTRREGVILAEGVAARRGDGEVYQEVFQEPLHQGTEFRLLEERSGWYHIQLADNRTGWIPADSGELIQPF